MTILEIYSNQMSAKVLYVNVLVQIIIYNIWHSSAFSKHYCKLCCCFCVSHDHSDEGTALPGEDGMINMVKNSTLLDHSHAQDLALQQPPNLSSILGMSCLFIIHNFYLCSDSWCISHKRFCIVLSIWQAVMLLLYAELSLDPAEEKSFSLSPIW